MKGKETPDNEFDALEVTSVVPVADVTYAVDDKAFAGGDLGRCNAGA